MRINELIEGFEFDELKFLKPNENKGRDLDFDLPEDLMFFMNHNDDIYRKLLYPTISKVIIAVKRKEPFEPAIFKPAIQNSYSEYVKKYPIRELPDELDDKLCNEVCKKMHETTLKHIKDGKYKD